ncbi:hypothetical protein CHS0354_015524 [Potamilus streckersoni]|uniref:Uncharacterized protein n=1 Tax=Potamilus streckersoni TaxID=2493646 RepID=A0AAE0SEQ7_9BIVA|nr:hypothetical protein CHS0354_015524 [Potamilus streckersoni]
MAAARKRTPRRPNASEGVQQVAKNWNVSTLQQMHQPSVNPTTGASTLQQQNQKYWIRRRDGNVNVGGGYTDRYCYIVHPYKCPQSDGTAIS